MSNFTTPTGRLVFGSPFTPQAKKDDDGKPVLDRVTGEVVMEYTVGVAFDKKDPATAAFIEELRVEDRAAWPAYFGPDGNVAPGVVFADKIKDGDGFDRKRQPYARKDGWAGHFIVTFTSRFAPSVHAHDGRQWAQITGGVKPGDYIRVSGTTVTNGNTDPKRTAGMYRNLGMVAKIGDGAPIIVGADANEVFGAAPPPLPPGATTTPQAPAAPVPMVAPPAAPAPVQAAPLAAPYTAYMEAPPAAPTAPPPAPAAPPPAPPAPVRTMLPAANGATYESLIAVGWNDALLVQHGMMAG